MVELTSGMFRIVELEAISHRFLNTGPNNTFNLGDPVAEEKKTHTIEW